MHLLGSHFPITLNECKFKQDIRQTNRTRQSLKAREPIEVYRIFVAVEGGTSR